MSVGMVLGGGDVGSWCLQGGLGSVVVRAAAPRKPFVPSALGARPSCVLGLVLSVVSPQRARDVARGRRRLALGGQSVFVALSWFNPSQQLSTTQPLPPSPSQWGEEEERGEKKENSWVEIRTVS